MHMTTPPTITRRCACEVFYYSSNNYYNHSGLSEDRRRAANDDSSIVDPDEIVATATIFHGGVTVEDRDDAVTQATIATASNAANGTPTTTTSSCSSRSVYWTPPSTERMRNIIPTSSVSTWDGPNLPMFPSLDDDDDDRFAVAAWNDTGSNTNNNSESNTDVGVVVDDHTRSSDTDVFVDLPEATVIQVYDDDTDVWYEASEFLSTPTPTSITTGHAVLASDTTTTTSTTTSSSLAPMAYCPHLVHTRRNLTPIFEILAEVSTDSVLNTDGMIKTKKRKI